MRSKPEEERAGNPREAAELEVATVDVEFVPPSCPGNWRADGEDEELWLALWWLGGPDGTYHPIADYQIIQRYVELTRRRQDMLTVLDDEGYTVTGSQGQDVQHPASRVLADVEAKLVPLEDRLGLSPQARHTINLGKVQAVSALEKWMAGGHGD